MTEESFDELYNMPVGALGIIGMPGSEELAQKVNDYIVDWRNNITSIPQSLSGGYMRDKYQIGIHCPRFGTGEGKATISGTVRGYDLFIIADMFNYGVTYKLYGKDDRKTFGIPQKTKRLESAKKPNEAEQSKSSVNWQEHWQKRKQVDQRQWCNRIKQKRGISETRNFQVGSNPSQQIVNGEDSEGNPFDHSKNGMIELKEERDDAD